jgi:hypothetical protein
VPIASITLWQPACSSRVRVSIACDAMTERDGRARLEDVT